MDTERGAEQGVRAEHRSMMRHRTARLATGEIICDWQELWRCDWKRHRQRHGQRLGRRCLRHWFWKWLGPMTCVCVVMASMRERSPASRAGRGSTCSWSREEDMRSMGALILRARGNSRSSGGRANVRADGEMHMCKRGGRAGAGAAKAMISLAQASCGAGSASRVTGGGACWREYGCAGPDSSGPSSAHQKTERRATGDGRELRNLCNQNSASQFTEEAAPTNPCKL